MNEPALPSNLHERAKRLVRHWNSIRSNDTTTHREFNALLNRLMDEGLDTVDEVVKLAALQLNDIDHQAQFRRDVMCRAGHLEAMGHSLDKEPAQIFCDAFAVPIMGERAMMKGLLEKPEAIQCLVEAMGMWGDFSPSRLAIMEVLLPVEMANCPSLAQQLAHELGLLTLTPEQHVLEEEEIALQARLEPMAVPTQGKGVALLVGVRVWVGPPGERAAENDLLLNPAGARALESLRHETAWQEGVTQALSLAELPPGSIALFPPSTFLRAFAQGRALEMVQGMCEWAHQKGISSRIDHLVTGVTDTQHLVLIAKDKEGAQVAVGPGVPMADVHVEGQAFMETVLREGGAVQPRTQMQMRRRGLH